MDPATSDTHPAASSIATDEITIDYHPFDPDSIDSPVTAVLLQTQGKEDELPMHVHRKGQLVVALRGSVMCRSPNGWWIVPPNGAVWIPGGIPHSNHASDFASLYVICIAPDAADMPQECRSFTITPLIRELIRSLARLSPFYPEEGPTSRLATVLLDQLTQLAPDDVFLPISDNHRLQQIASSLLDNPADRSTIAEWGRRYAMSERTLARLVLSETGMTFGRWRERLHIIIALQRLSAGASVHAVSLELGYEGPNSFITMFKKTMGQSPGKFRVEKIEASQP
ncbi:helix-turn-helix transcriptional regulator [Paraburkholderia sp. D15]|uniref:AraC family transcriptional regulator n=1 Tax=Paraburkholderia sp. D15 TaxID=2880218 RepID=UPI0024788E4F|nr:helix-turn-helix transcriptional regulator [Paraburkholderia sp. D15]WGS52841.1 helix-turn-helix transcriptional regulator [Paraburkholderia sp. D15]